MHHAKTLAYTIPLLCLNTHKKPNYWNFWREDKIRQVHIFCNSLISWNPSWSEIRFLPCPPATLLPQHHHFRNYFMLKVNNQQQLRSQLPPLLQKHVVIADFYKCNKYTLTLAVPPSVSKCVTCCKRKLNTSWEVGNRQCSQCFALD